MFKKNISMLTACVVLSSLPVMSSYAEDGKVNFTGEVLETACQVVSNEKAPLSVALGKVNKTSFNGKGSSPASTKFTLTLKDCPESLKIANVKFDGVPDTNDTSVIGLIQGTGVASGVGVKLYNADSSALPLRTSSTDYKLVTGDNDLDFYASYVALVDNTAIQAGIANATATFTVTYGN